MNSESFLESIYFGSMDMERFHFFKDLEADEKTNEIISKYLEATEKYPALDLEEKGTVPPELFEKLKGSGFFGLNIPEEYGGVGLNMWQYLKVVEEITSRDLALALISLAHLSIGCKGIVLFGNEAQKKKYLIPAAAGEMIFSYALTEPNIGSDAKNIETKAVLSEDGSHYVLSGRKTYITTANYAGGLTVFAQMDPERPGFMGAFIVETSWDGVEIAGDNATLQLREVSHGIDALMQWVDELGDTDVTSCEELIQEALLRGIAWRSEPDPEGGRYCPRLHRRSPDSSHSHRPGTEHRSP